MSRSKTRSSRFARLGGWATAVAGFALGTAAWALQDQFRLSWWDALVLASAQLAGCQTLLSEDFQHGQQFGDVRVSNPFRASPDDDD